MSFIDEFEKHYDYDCSYMRLMQENSSDGFETFLNFLPMGQFQKKLSKNDIWIARLASIVAEDCGACTQLNIKMAAEAGVKEELIKKVIRNPEKLDRQDKLIYDYAQAVVKNSDNCHDYQFLISKLYDKEQLTEFALAISSTKVYPTIKRALGFIEPCLIEEFNFS